MVSTLLRSASVGAALLLLMLAGCASDPKIVAKNSPLCPAGSKPFSSIDAQGAVVRTCRTATSTQAMPSQSVPRATTSFAEGTNNFPDNFVGVSISGGGSRAAVFGMRVLRELDRLGILQHVTAVSTTSGGGLPGAYTALAQRPIDWNAAEDLMAKDFLGAWLRRNVQPSSLLSVMVSAKDRSDLLSEVFDELLFHNKKFSDLGDFHVGSSPIWLANATDIAARARFTFSEQNFDIINSDMADLPISTAVMSSAAFPGVFNSVTLRDFASVYEATGVTTYTPALESYKHLIDGGPTDNLGVEALLQLATSHANVRSASGSSDDSNLGHCLLIVVDAHARGNPARSSLDADPRGKFGRFIDLNFFDAIDSLLEARRLDLLGYLGLDDPGEYAAHSSAQFSYVDFPRVQRRPTRNAAVGLSTLFPFGSYEAFSADAVRSTAVERSNFRCGIWHISLSALEAQLFGHAPPTTDSGMAGRESFEIDEQVGLLQLVVSRIGTNFRLTGPANCSKEFLQAALQEAATLVTYEDYRNQGEACDWLKGKGLNVHSSCGTYKDIGSLQRLPIRGRVKIDKEAFQQGRASGLTCRAR